MMLKQLKGCSNNDGSIVVSPHPRRCSKMVKKQPTTTDIVSFYLGAAILNFDLVMLMFVGECLCFPVVFYSMPDFASYLTLPSSLYLSWR